MHTIPVLICGAGPVGLSLSLALSRLGIQNIIVEKHPGTSIHPKARGVNVRTMELFRQWGIEDAIRSHELPDKYRRFLWLESIKGNNLGEVTLEENDVENSPTTSCFIAQDNVEKALLAAVLEQTNSNVRFNTKLIAIKQDDNKVTCDIYNTVTHVTEKIYCQYCIAADGSHSFIRNTLGIKMHGEENLGSYVSVYCETDLTPWIDGKEAIISVFTNQSQRGKFLMAVDFQKKWIVAKRMGEMGCVLDKEASIALVCEAVEEPNLSVEHINTSVWQMAALNAEQYQVGRIFLAGDAAHRLPPTGGMGMNTGIQDAHNIAWKLAYVIKGYADATLLDSYQTERKLLAQYTIDWSCENARRITGVIETIENKDHSAFKQKLELQKNHLNHRGLDLGFIYGSNDFASGPYTPTAMVNTRAPHCNITITDNVISTLDLFDDQHVLLMGSDFDYNKSALPISESCPIKVFCIGKDIEPVDDLMTLYNLSAQDAVLIRPDGIVAWRS